MKNSTNDGFDQHYNVQVAVEQESFLIVSNTLSNHVTDQYEAIPTLDAIPTEVGTPKAGALDAGYFSEDNVAYLDGERIDPYVATGRQKHGESPPAVPRGRIPKGSTVKDRMSRKLRTKKGRETYSKRKGTVEPVFGQIKEVRGLRRFLLRGFQNVRGEWSLMCLTHNLLKLFRSGQYVPAFA